MALSLLGAGAANAAEPKDPQVLDKAQKLPVDLPSVLVRGEDQTAGPLLPGNKLSPDEPGAVAFSLPRPMNALDLDRYLAEASQSVLPSISVGAETLATSVDGFQEVRVGTGGWNRYDLNAYAARRFTQLPDWASGQAIARAEVDGRMSNAWTRTNGDWSRLGLRLQGSTEPNEASGSKVTASLGLEHQVTTLVGAQADSFAQRLALDGRYDFGPYAVGAAFQAGRVGDPAPAQSDSQSVQGQLTGSWRPELPWGEHAVEVSGTLGQRSSDKRNDPMALLSLRDTWSLRPEWAVLGRLDLGTVMSDPLVLPSAELRYRPSQVTEVTAGVRSEAWMPSADDLYLSRRYLAGNGALIDQRVPLRVDLSGSQRLSDRWQLRLEGSYLLASRWIAWQQTGGALELWRPYNPGLGLETGSVAQRAILGRVLAQYQMGGQAVQSFFYRVKTVDPLGEVVQEAGASHQSEWLRGKLKLELEFKVQLQQLGSGQTSQASSAGMQALAAAGASYQVSERMFAYLRMDSLPMLQVQPAANFFAPEALVVGGIGYSF